MNMSKRIRVFRTLRRATLGLLILGAFGTSCSYFETWSKTHSRSASSEKAESKGYEHRMSGLEAKPPTPFVGEAYPYVLYVELDSENISDSLTLPSKLGTITGARACFADNLAATFEPWFESVEVVEPGFTPQSDAYVIARVHFDKLRPQIRRVRDSSRTRTIPRIERFEMQWAFAMQLPEGDGYIFNHAADAYSPYHFDSTREALGAMVQRALTNLMYDWTSIQPIREMAS